MYPQVTLVSASVPTERGKKLGRFTQGDGIEWEWGTGGVWKSVDVRPFCYRIETAAEAAIDQQQEFAYARLISDVVLETKVMVSKRLEDKKITSWSWQKMLENFKTFC